MREFTEALRKRADQIVSDMNLRQCDAPFLGVISHEIALTVSQMERAKGLHEKQLRRLLRIECYVDTELMQMAERMPRYSRYWFPEKEKLHKRLFEIERDRRNLVLRLEERLKPLEDRLLELVNRHEQLDI